MEILTGIGKTDRERMAAIIRGTKGTVSVGEAARVLNVASTDAAKIAFQVVKKGLGCPDSQGRLCFCSVGISDCGCAA